MDARRKLLRTFAANHPEDVARRLERLPVTQAAAVLEDLPAEQSAELLHRMVAGLAATCLAALSAERLQAVLSLLPLDLAAALLRELEPDDQARVFEAAPGELAPSLAFLSQFEEGTAGALMNPRVLAVPEDVNVRDARARMRQAADRVKYYLYVVDREQKLVGVLNVRELLLASGREPLAGVMRTPVARVSVHADHRTILTHPAWREYHALPVVDGGERLVGAIPYRTLRRLEEEQQSRPPQLSPLVPVLALGELYWVALGRFLQAVASPRTPTGAGQPTENKEEP